MHYAALGVSLSSVPQQPQWDDLARVQRMRQRLRDSPALVSAGTVHELRSLLGRVAAGEANVIQAGDCAENPSECTTDCVARKAALLEVLGGARKLNTHKPVLRVGRIAGQFGKPRSEPIERVGHLELSVFRGHMVNAPEADPYRRRADPRRLLACYQAAREVVENLGWQGPSWVRHVDPPIWISHEALLLDYEIPMLRRDRKKQLFLGSAHWPWVGVRTGHSDGAHVAMLADVINPVACKIGPSMTASELRALCERLDPEREPGRLTLIARIGAETVTEVLPRLVAATRSAGHPVIWLCDPMHANTVRTPSGYKTRFLSAITREVRNFRRVVEEGGGTAGGLHLEITPDDVTECVPDEYHLGEVGDNYRSFCDPRLNLQQALTVISAWTGAPVPASDGGS